MLPEKTPQTMQTAEWSLSILRDGDGFQLVEGAHPEAIGEVSLLGSQLRASLREPLDTPSAEFMGQAVYEWLKTSGRIPQIAAAVLNHLGRQGA